VGQLLELARPMTVRKTPVPVDELIRDSLALIRRQAEENRISIEYEPAPLSMILSADRDKIGQVLLNLYLNAVDSMKDNTSDRVLSVSARNLGDTRKLEIRVSDVGAGIEDEHLAHVFDPFFTTKARGTGLGLAIVHNIMEAHGAGIEMASVPGEGTAVVLQFPSEDLP
jgi:two-component system sensor histidine kinase HydH